MSGIKSKQQKHTILRSRNKSDIPRTLAFPTQKHKGLSRIAYTVGCDPSSKSIEKVPVEVLKLRERVYVSNSRFEKWTRQKQHSNAGLNRAAVRNFRIVSVEVLSCRGPAHLRASTPCFYLREDTFFFEKKICWRPKKTLSAVNSPQTRKEPQMDLAHNRDHFISSPRFSHVFTPI